MAIGGLDIGTTGCKLTVYDNQGTYRYKAYRDYPSSRGGEVQEIRAEYIWKSVREVIREAAEHCPDIQGVGVTSFGETFVLLDENDTPLAPCMLYTDPRGDAECRELTEKLGEKYIADITGLKPHCMYSISKLMWVRKHRPDIYNRTARILLMEDYIIYMLTGNPQIDYSIASRTMAFDIRKLCWSREILKAAQIKEKLLSKTVPTGTCAGTVKTAVAGDLGLSGGTIIVSVSHDQVAAAIGSRVFGDAAAVDGAGTVECITPVFTGIPKNDVLYQGSYAIVPYVFPGKYLCYAFSFTGGALVKWYIDNLAKYEKTLADREKSSVYEVLESNMQDGPTGILVLPHFAGAATPYMDSGSKGAITGLTAAHNVSDLYRAMLEGVVYEMRLNMEELAKAGIVIKKLKAVGGGANSRVWMQMKADILGVPIVSLGSSEAGAAGSAMLTGIACNIFGDLEEAAEAMVKELETYYPRLEQREAYEQYYEKYRQLYPSVRHLMGQ